MKQTEPPKNTASGRQESNTLHSLEKNISSGEAEKFWKVQQGNGNVDVIFKHVQNKLHILWKKIKDGSATSQEYLQAMVLVTEAGLDVPEATRYEKNVQERLQESQDCASAVGEDSCLDITSKREPEDAYSQPEYSSLTSLSVRAKVTFKKHTCSSLCVSEDTLLHFKKENPMKLPILCHFQRRHGKSDWLSRELDVIYKAPCGKSLRNYKEVLSYLFETECCILCVDNFSFSTYLQLERPMPSSQPVVHDVDISKDVESMPVSFCNDIDSTRPSSFKYRKSSWPCGYSINNFTDIFVDSCNCTDGCLDVSTCACLQMTARAYSQSIGSAADVIFGYKYKRLEEPIPSGLYECNLSCKCDRRMCQNRVVQHGLQMRLQVFKTRKRGWGVRCLDDIDQGTFVCTYAGRIFIKRIDDNLKNVAEPSDSFDEEIEENKSTTVSSVIAQTRKRRISHSDSEVTLLNATTYSMSKITEMPLSAHCKPKISRMKEKISSGKNSDYSIRRPKTKTSILQKRRKQLMEEGACTLQHSSEDECPTFPSSDKRTKSSDVYHEDYNDNNDECTARSELLQVKERNDAALDYVSDESSTSVQSGVYPLVESISEDKVASLKSCLSKAGSSICPHTTLEEHVCILDATKEGNVGRFLNHSCSPNLFVQNVFVETHHKSFPWVAFFTKKLVKAGTELTWGYNYDVGSDPENEIPCRCGHQTCRNITI